VSAARARFVDEPDDHPVLGEHGLDEETRLDPLGGDPVERALLGQRVGDELATAPGDQVGRDLVGVVLPARPGRGGQRLHLQGQRSCHLRVVLLDGLGSPGVGLARSDHHVVHVGSPHWVHLRW